MSRHEITHKDDNFLVGFKYGRRWDHSTFTSAPLPMPVYDPLQIPSYASDPEYREYLLLRLLAKIFEFELEIERRLQCAGSGKLPDEWRAYRERELQKTWDKVHRYELDRARAVQDEESISLSHGFSAGVGYPPPPDVHHDPRTRITSVPYTMDDGVYISQPAGRSTPARRHGMSSYRVYLLPLTIACARIADSSASPDFTAFGGEERAQPQNQQLAISATSSMAFNTLSRLSDGGNPESKCTILASPLFP